jgi:aldehyde dehydrogenase family 7 member A1
MPDADLSLAVPAVFFGSVGTAGQRCTSTRRLYLHRTIAPEFLSRLQNLYASLKPGDPLDPRTLLGPLHAPAALDIYDSAIAELRAAGANILVGAGRYSHDDDGVLPPPLDRGNFVRPTLAVPPPATLTTTATGVAPLWATERFAPILYIAEFDELEQAIAWNNAVPQGLSSSLWTRDMRNVGKWIGPAGSDTGIVNVSVHFGWPAGSIAICTCAVWLICFSYSCRSTLVLAARRLVLRLAGIKLVPPRLLIFWGETR